MFFSNTVSTKPSKKDVSSIATKAAQKDTDSKSIRNKSVCRLTKKNSHRYKKHKCSDVDSVDIKKKYRDSDTKKSRILETKKSRVLETNKSRILESEKSNFEIDQEINDNQSSMLHDVFHKTDFLG